jgi:protein SCO1/2
VKSRFQFVRLTVGVLGILMTASAVFGQGMTKGMMSPPANMRPPGLEQVGITQKLDTQLPLDLTFRDETGKTVQLKEYFGKKPVILNFAYYTCPMLCGELLKGLTTSLKGLKFELGNEFDVVTVSIDPHDTPETATEKKAEYLQRYGHPERAAGWHFLTGSQESITALTKAAGFGYQYNEQTMQFAHATAIMIVTPQGKLAQYFYGIDFAPKDLRLGIVQASNEKIGNLVDQVLLYCYHYDPATGKYGAIVARVLKLSGLATVLGLGLLIVVLVRIGPINQDKDTNSRHYV